MGVSKWERESMLRCHPWPLPTICFYPDVRTYVCYRLIAGACAGVSYWATTYPLDAIKVCISQSGIPHMHATNISMLFACEHTYVRTYVRTLALCAVPTNKLQGYLSNTHKQTYAHTHIAYIFTHLDWHRSLSLPLSTQHRAPNTQPATNNPQLTMTNNQQLTMTNNQQLTMTNNHQLTMTNNQQLTMTNNQQLTMTNKPTINND